MREIPIISSEGLFALIRKLTAKEGTEIIPITSLYDRVYCGIDDLFLANERISSGEELLTEQDKKALVGAWKAGLENKDLSVELEYLTDDDRLATIPLQVTPRTNFDTLSRNRRPNIFQLLTSSGHVLYFRSACFYPTAQVPSFRTINFGQEWGCKDPQTMIQYRVTVDNEWYVAFNNGVKHRLLTTQNGKSPYSIPFVFIPEPHLHGVLESLYCDGLPRVTPKMRVVGITERDVFLVRPSLDIVIDVSINEEVARALGKYFGTLHAIGLTDKYDRQLEHYALQPTENGELHVVNYDTDFMLYDRRTPNSRHSDFTLDAKLVLREISQRYPMVSKREFKAFKEGWKEAFEITSRLIGEQYIHDEVYRRLHTQLNQYETLKALFS